MIPASKPHTMIISIFFFFLQMLMNAQVMRQMNVTPTPFVPTVRDPTSAAVRGDTPGMEETVLVGT